MFRVTLEKSEKWLNLMFLPGVCFRCSLSLGKQENKWFINTSRLLHCPCPKSSLDDDLLFSVFGMKTEPLIVRSNHWMTTEPLMVRTIERHTVTFLMSWRDSKETDEVVFCTLLCRVFRIPKRVNI